MMNSDALFSIEAFLRHHGRVETLLELDALLSENPSLNAEQQAHIHHIIERALQL